MALGCQLSVILEEPNCIYKAGDTLAGSVCLLAKKTQHITGVELTLRGAADIRWEEVKHEARGKTDVEHCAQEVYFHENILLWGTEEKDKCTEEAEEFQAGRHLFPFTYSLPDELPCSFEGSNGCITYSVTAVVSAAKDLHFKETCFFTILGELDLSAINEKEENSEGDEDSIIRSSCCTAGRINCSLNVPQRFLVPGQQLSASVDVKNMSARKIKSCSLILMQTEIYATSSGVSHRVRNELHQVPFGKSIKQGKRHCWNCDSIFIPPVPPSNLQPCRFVSIAYHLVLRLSLYPHPAEISVPLVVGTVPQSKFLYSYWYYAAQFRPGKKQLARDFTDAFLAPKNWMPLYRVYKPLSPIQSMLSLQESPVCRRKKLDLDIDLRNNESVI